MRRAEVRCEPSFERCRTFTRNPRGERCLHRALSVMARRLSNVVEMFADRLQSAAKKGADLAP